MNLPESALTMYTIAIATLGCKVNQFETDSLIAQLSSMGATIVTHQEFADIYIVNACTVTHTSDSKTRQLIRSLHRRNPNAVLIITGCLTLPHSLPEDKEGIPYHIIPNTNKANIPKLILEYKNTKIFPSDQNYLLGNSTGKPLENASEYQPKDTSFLFPTGRTSYHTRAYLKIQDGCDAYCTYCRIPFVRGTPLSRSFKDVLAASKALVEQGNKEIVLTGIHIGKYSYSGLGIASVVESLIDFPEDFRIRLSSIEVTEISELLIQCLQHPKCCPHLHIPLQSGSDSILHAMNRPYTQQQYLDTMEAIKHTIPDCILTTDVMVGFPGETDKDFQDTLDTLKIIQPYHVHTFMYSPRPQTKAAQFPNQLPPKIKQERSRLVREFSAEQQQTIRTQWIGKTARILIEKESFDETGVRWIEGYSAHWIRVKCSSEDAPIGIFVEVELQESTQDNVIGILK